MGIGGLGWVVAPDVRLVALVGYRGRAEVASSVKVGHGLYKCFCVGEILNLWSRYERLADSEL